MDETVVVATRLRVRSPQVLPAFLRAANTAAEQARRAPGFLGGALRVERGLVFWTLTVWDGGRSMAGYRDSDPHGAIMGSIHDWANEGAFAVWRQAGAAVPGWDEVGRHITERVRISTLRHTSAAQARGEVPPPRPRALVVRPLTPV